MQTAAAKAEDEINSARSQDMPKVLQLINFINCCYT